MASQHQGYGFTNNPQSQPGRPAQQPNGNFVPQGQERTEQIETLQQYESQVQQTEDDVNQATLQREFPTIDSSLIAALYSDSKNLSATREMLHELVDTK